MIALFLTVIATVYFNNVFAGTRVYRPLMSKRSHAVSWLLVFLVFWAMCFGAIQVNAPLKLQITHPDVVEHKARMRQECILASATYDFATQEACMRDRELSRSLNQAYESGRRKTMANTAQKWGNTAVISIGMLWSVLPFQVLAFLKTVDSLVPVSRVLPILNSEEYWLVTTPVTNGALCMACVVFATFHFYIMEEQVEGCLLVSGHWFTIACTVFSFLGVSTHLYNHSDLGTVGSLLSFYLAYFAIFLGMASLVLKRSQLFHHDDLESKAGIEAAAYAILVAGPAFLFVTHRTVESNRKHKIQEFKECWAAALVAHVKRSERKLDVRTMFRKWKTVTDNLEATATAVVEDMQKQQSEAPPAVAAVPEKAPEAGASKKSKPADTSTPKRVTRAATAAATQEAPAPAAEEEWKAKKRELMLSVMRSTPKQEAGGEAAPAQPESSGSQAAAAVPRRPPMLFSAGDLTGAKLKKAPASTAKAAVASEPAKPNLMAEIMNAKRNKLKPATKRKAKALPQKTEPPSMMDEIRLRMQARHERMKAEADDDAEGDWD
jgi:outer membrane biosynthesis protein TonB